MNFIVKSWCHNSQIVNIINSTTIFYWFNMVYLEFFTTSFGPSYHPAFGDNGDPLSEMIS